MAAHPAVAAERTRPGGSSRGWRPIDRAGLALCWAAGISLCVLAGSIVLYLLVRGIQYLNLDLLVTHPQPDLDQSKTGGFFDPLVGTFALTIIGIVFAAPLGVATAVWLSEYGRPFWLARAVESGVEVVAGTPSIVLAIFGLVVFQQNGLGFLSFTGEGDAVFGRSFLTAGAMMALIALPLVVGSTREALQAIPGHVREASYALGKSRIASIRRVLIPGARKGIATGATLGMGRIAGDTAIVVILLGGSLQLESATDTPILGDLRGTGSTLTSYVYNNSPAGEGNAAQKAYAAAFVLLLIVILLNFVIDLIARDRKGTASWT